MICLVLVYTAVIFVLLNTFEYSINDTQRQSGLVRDDSLASEIAIIAAVCLCALCLYVKKEVIVFKVAAVS